MLIFVQTLLVLGVVALLEQHPLPIGAPGGRQVVAKSRSQSKKAAAALDAAAAKAPAPRRRRAGQPLADR